MAAIFNWQCALNLHVWSKWKELEAPATPAKAGVNHIVQQKRECPACGKIQLRSEAV